MEGVVSFTVTRIILFDQQKAEKAHKEEKENLASHLVAFKKELESQVREKCGRNANAQISIMH